MVDTVENVQAKEIKRFFAQQFKDVSNASPFAIPRADEIEAALYDGSGKAPAQANRGAVVECSAGRIVACALLTYLRAPSRQTDFTQRHGFKMEADSTIVTHIAVAEECDDEHWYNFLRELSAMTTEDLLIELYEERERDKAVIDALEAATDTGAMALSAVKVSAYAEIKGLYTTVSTGVPRANYESEELATLETLSATFLSEHAFAIIMDELRLFSQEAPNAFANHYSLYNKRDTWSAFAVRGYSDDPGFIIKPREMTRKWQRENSEKLLWQCRDTAAAPFFRGTMKLLDDLIPGHKQRVRFMKLSSEGELSRHCDIQDKEAGVADNMIARLHIPLVTNKLVNFVVWDTTGKRIVKHMSACGLHYLDVRKPHSAFNNCTNIDRIHLVVDVHSTEELRRMIRHATTR